MLQHPESIWATAARTVTRTIVVIIVSAVTTTTVTIAEIEGTGGTETETEILMAGIIGTGEIVAAPLPVEVVIHLSIGDAVVIQEVPLEEAALIGMGLVVDGTMILLQQLLQLL